MRQMENELPRQERLEKLFDDGEDVLCRNPNVSFLHDIWFLSVLFGFVVRPPSGGQP